MSLPFTATHANITTPYFTQTTPTTVIPVLGPAISLAGGGTYEVRAISRIPITNTPTSVGEIFYRLEFEGEITTNPIEVLVSDRLNARPTQRIQAQTKSFLPVGIPSVGGHLSVAGSIPYIYNNQNEVSEPVLYLSIRQMGAALDINNLYVYLSLAVYNTPTIAQPPFDNEFRIQ